MAVDAGPPTRVGTLRHPGVKTRGGHALLMCEEIDLSNADVPENYQRQVLMLVLWAGAEWCTIEELGRKVGDLVMALDAMRVLSDAGLIHRQEQYVFPTVASRFPGELTEV